MLKFKQMADVRTRFAPSPTGSMHIGNLRTAFYAYALAKHNNGKFILRIEDTDKKREAEGGVEEIKSLLNIFALSWDEFYIQSERLGIYKKAAEKLVSEGHAFYCQCEGKNAKKEGFSTNLRDECRDKGLTSGAIKLKVPDNEVVSFHDFVLKEDVTWHTPVVFDATLLKSDGYPTYHLAVVVDDNDMKISHVLRGHDWLPSTPIHLLVYRFLGFKVPEIGHLTDILDPEGGKLSKRKGSSSVKKLLSEGYLPEAIFNFVILAGWAPKDNQEFFDVKSFVEKFDIKGFQKSNPIFNQEKLDWFNGHYIRNKSESDLVSMIYDFYKGKYDKDLLRSKLPLFRDRIKKFSEIESFAGPLVNPSVHPEPLKVTTNYLNNISNATISQVENIKDWTQGNVNQALGTAQLQSGSAVGDFYMDMRGTIFGNTGTPPVNDSIYELGKDWTIVQLRKGQEKHSK
ncbi:glutamate--tRNA ligase [Candidatus Woesebacteria bacterium RIFCSPHIGHO2_01_FULL_44_21]|uniref:Glutamate--tRNA ligase n=1 Tax=Candidatus Woesebacteria bacterium RIFCSPHIGHO2_01_FULL_44_21 TaxID=1802503 RepID=A0A1F7YX87_9BACT|nr:MAG: glutamate--tRNA ligase [Candidatus Woesebacteria bacterium RIFCSPHIGHO2_01_FULL_44_21]OGM70426.1 MAG: glutamate--tRNA ligase [Candidatus Woesebacteria bacterium RIFCSPLOWO2_01_FULL_44_24b]